MIAVSLVVSLLTFVPRIFSRESLCVTVKFTTFPAHEQSAGVEAGTTVSVVGTAFVVRVQEAIVIAVSIIFRKVLVKIFIV